MNRKFNIQYIIFLYVLIFFSCFKMPEIIKEGININNISNEGFSISLNEIKTDEKIFDCFVLSNDKEYYELIGFYDGIMKTYPQIHLQTFSDNFKSIVKIHRTYTDQIIIKGLESNTIYYIALFEFNTSTKNIRINELINIKTLE